MQQLKGLHHSGNVGRPLSRYAAERANACHEVDTEEEGKSQAGRAREGPP